MLQDNLHGTLTTMRYTEETHGIRQTINEDVAIQSASSLSETFLAHFCCSLESNKLL